MLVITGCGDNGHGICVWSVMMLQPDSCNIIERHLTFTAREDTNVVEGEPVLRMTIHAADRVDIRPLLDAARDRCKQRVDELTGLGGPGHLLLVFVKARRLVERLGEVVCLKQLDDEAFLVDGDNATV